MQFDLVVDYLSKDVQFTKLGITTTTNESCFKIIKHLITYKYIIQEQENLKKRKSQNA